LIKTVDDGGGRPQIRSDAFRSDPARNVLAQVYTDAELTAWLDEVLPLPDDTPRVVSRAAALRDFGVHAIAYRLRAGQWRRLAPSVYLTSPPATPVDRMHAAALHGGSRCAISGAAALFALGFRAVRPPSAELVLVRSDSGVESWGRIRVRRTARLPRPLWRSGLPLAPVARAVADQALQLRRLDRVQAVVAEAVQRRMCDVAELAAELEAGPRQGSRLLRAALRDVGYGALSVPEAKAARLMRKAAIAEFEQNAACTSAAGTLSSTFCGVTCERYSRSTAPSTTSRPPTTTGHWLATRCCRQPDTPCCTSSRASCATPPCSSS
jgi:hypothetical protein